MGIIDLLLKKEEEKPAKAVKLTVEGEEEEELPTGAIALDGEEPDEEEDDAKSAPEDRATAGPFDIGELDAEAGYLDLGALRLPVREGLGLRLEVEKGTERLVAVVLDYRESSIQIQAFAAPKMSGLWRSIREQIAAQIQKQGGTADTLETELGPAIHMQNAGKSVIFLGVDGPRWFLRGALSGKAVEDEAVRAELIELFRTMVVLRGDAPLPPRELLTLVVPRATAEPDPDA